MKKTMKAIIILVTTIATLGISWGICCGLLKLISICFGLNFSIKVATGIWLALAFIKLLRGTNKKKVWEDRKKLKK